MTSFDKIICVGKNYLEHAKELGDAIPDKPVIFLKPPSILKQAQQWGENLLLSLPQTSSDINYECEVVLKINKDGYQVSSFEAEQMIGWVTLGLDMTLRTLQSTLKKNGHPWTTAKVFIDSAIVGPWIPYHEFPNYIDTPFSLALNNEMKQQAFPNEMLLQPEDIIAYISHFFPLCNGDLIFTGTPAGVDAVTSGSTAQLSWGKYQYSASWR